MQHATAVLPSFADFRMGDSATDLLDQNIPVEVAPVMPQQIVSDCCSSNNEPPTPDQRPG